MLKTWRRKKWGEKKTWEREKGSEGKRRREKEERKKEGGSVGGGGGGGGGREGRRRIQQEKKRNRKKRRERTKEKEGKTEVEKKKERERERRRRAMETKSSEVTQLHNAVIVMMDSDSHVFYNGAIVVEKDRIVALGQSHHIFNEFAPRSQNVFDLHGQILLPGFINTHVHTSQQLGRGIADDVDLMTWLHERIWPYESNMTEEDSYISTLLCGIELIHTGVTCFAEAGGQYVLEMARAVELLGLRACLVESIMDCGEGLPPSWAGRTADDCIQSQKELYKKHHDTADGRIRMWLGVRQTMNAT